MGVLYTCNQCFACNSHRLFVLEEDSKHGMSADATPLYNQVAMLM